ncbi:RNA polymerase sigma-70 factor [Pedobacter sp. MC2016-14]|uniref:RNA polymerase sigma-70 factor n=1 Tax=Pedobacter sp. MC2016-14 TaxID=2897327 RepID=UPI001E545D61|nr:RNA polymerase sigma-70 factor [Pedobacter sp. MC2016-14]MCD0490422.1 RNA polymerase sigma-70 factor [Pedobacter sp. MC2016-14]
MSEQQDEQHWTRSFQNGDDNALAHFFKLHNKSLCYFAKRMVQDDEEAEDIVADCFLKLWERRQSFENATNIKSFLFISCRNASLDYLKHLKVKTVAQQTYFSQLSQSEDNILYTIMEAEFLEILSQEIELLPEKCKQIFKLIYFEGKKTDEIALELDLSVQTVRNQKTRAVELLRTVFLKKGMSNAFAIALMLFAGKN